LVLRKQAVLGGVAAAILGLSIGSPMAVAAPGAERTISLFHIHTKESISVTYKRDGKFDEEALKKLNWFLRDWRVDEATTMDRETIDLLWEMHTELGSSKPIHIISAYRSEKTNSMLRKTRGGQAKKSKHITGQAIDVTFPDIPLKQLRYSALVHEVGGVGYYPNSGIPFVHVDSGRVRAWPRVPRKELALLFPNGKTEHRPSSGGPVTPADARKARESDKELAQQIAAFHEMRKNPRRVTVAQTTPPPMLSAPPRQVVTQTPEVKVAALEAGVAVNEAVVAPAPKLVRGPRVATPPPSDIDRGRLDQLVTLASLTPNDIPPALRSRPDDGDRHRLNALIDEAAGNAAEQPKQVPPPAAALPPRQSPVKLGDDANKGLKHGASWVAPTEFDDDHPEELSYRPFPIAPLLTTTASADDEALVKIVHPKIERTLELLDEREIVLPMRLRTGDQITQVLWAQQFKGNAVEFPGQQIADAPGSGITSRPVRTSAR
jgi:uncharacterized protein YcbK (DUF882 family)